jgi:1-acyl-sn-glycerol-3-phosphate acyltransferase
LLYKLLKFPASVALKLYCRKVYINHKAALQSEGPLLIAANHPNSFLDAIILATLFKSPIYSLARGDAFVNKGVSRLLHSFNILPIYRLSEGADKLHHNYTTFSDCLEIFKKKGVVLIFSEAGCLNEWKLRPIRKGTARLAYAAWQEGIPLKVLPLGINYNSFRSFGKTVFLNFGNTISQDDISPASGGAALAEFNSLLTQQLQPLVIEEGEASFKMLYRSRPSVAKTILLTIPAAIGWIAHAPLYYAIIAVIHKIADDHYDAVVVGTLFFFYPIYLLAICLLAWHYTTTPYSWLLMPVLPFCAWALLQIKGPYVPYNGRVRHLHEKKKPAVVESAGL